MKTQQFKTTIKCSGCLNNLTPHLNEHLSPEEWNVDILNPSKILTVNSDKLSSEQIQQVVKKAGFEIEPINE